VGEKGGYSNGNGNRDKRIKEAAVAGCRMQDTRFKILEEIFQIAEVIVFV